MKGKRINKQEGLFEAVSKVLSHNPKTTKAKMLGVDVLKVKGKVFAMPIKGNRNYLAGRHRFGLDKSPSLGYVELDETAQRNRPPTD